MVPLAILGAGALIAGALYFAGREPTQSDVGGDASKVPAVSADDHILGNPDAPVVIIEYTDIECPYCKRFHATMEDIMNTYGKEGKVAWVLRNFPIAQMHPNAPKLAMAAECIAHELGNAAYWNFLTQVFTVAPVGTFFPMDRLTEVALKVGANADTFNTCVAKDTFKDRITREFNDAVATGGTGTPHSIIVTRDGQTVVMDGAQPFATVKAVIDSVVGQSDITPP